jgi:tetratricopeptide (TPR) repeat protein
MSSADNNKKIAADCWRRGNEALPKENWDYAIQMYSTSVKLFPDNLTYRHSLRFTEYKKYGNNGSGAKMAGMRLMTVKGRIKKARLSKDWQTVDATAEEGLQINPWDVSLNFELGDACRARGYNEVAIFAYEEALKKEPLNVPINKALAEVLEERGEYKRAAECWQRIAKAEPHNTQARSKMIELDTKKVLDHGGYEGAETTRGVMADHEIAKRLNLGKEADGPGMSVEADLQRAIRKEPANKDHYLKLADLYRREGKLEEAETHLKKALEISGGNVSIREQLEDVQLEMMGKAVEIAKEQFRANLEDKALKQRAVDLSNELLKREVEVFSGRVERYPQDLRIKYELAKRHMKMQKWQLAIPLFQQARGDQRIKGEALVALGKCFFYDNKPQLARRQFEAATTEVNYEEQPELYKDAYYSLGRLCEEMKEATVAEECYQKVLEVDYGFRDTVKRLDALQAGRTGEA